jgi:hypothetical protein
VRLSEEDYQQIMKGRGLKSSEKLKKPSKYKNERVTVDGIKFDSRKVANRYCELKLLRADGAVKNFTRQVPFDLPGGIRYFLDFMVWWDDGHISYEDTKGVRTDVYIMKKKQVEELYPIKIEEL